jgi:transcriptional regulator with XRE-family HTH domain
MSTAIHGGDVGGLLRAWRQRRRLSQLDLAVEADVSARHLSFVETGRARPSRSLLLHLADQLDVPLRERNALLLAGGYAPSYRETPLAADEMTPVRDALDAILGGHEPFPALVVDRRWDIVAANRPALAIVGAGVAPELLTPPVNALRISLHPRGLSPRIVNLAEYSAHLLHRLHRQATLAGDAELVALADELRSYPGVSEAQPAADGPAALLFVPLVLQVSPTERLTFFSTLATFGTALDVTLAELAIEAFFPADAATASALRDAWSAPSGSDGASRAGG